MKLGLKPFNSYDNEEESAATRVVQSGILSGFLGIDGPQFLGGPEVIDFEKEVQRFFCVDHAITVNSWSSGLLCALGAIDLEPGDEVITTPWTMSATAMSIINWNAIPVFADIDPKTYCISPLTIQKAVTKRTKAVVAVDIFGHSCDYDEIRKVLPKHIKIISDSAQAPGATYKGEFCGTIADIGGFSLNCHKHIHTGEGGVITTNDRKLAERCRLIRNHAESVIMSRPDAPLSNMLGYNLRMGEIEAAIGKVQLAKLPAIIKTRTVAASLFTELLSKSKSLTVPSIDPNYKNVYYMYPLLLDESICREKVLKSLGSHGINFLQPGYTNIHLLPLFRHKKVYGNSDLPWSLSDNTYSYEPGLCPVAESFHQKRLINIPLNHYHWSKGQIHELCRIILKSVDEAKSV